MEETINLKSIVLSRQDFKENDSLVTFYSREKGKLTLVARGVKKNNSKISGHIEPFNLVDLMFVSGRQYDYVGSIKSLDNFCGIKNSLDKIEVGSKIIKTIKKINKEGEADNRVFDFFVETLFFLDREDDFNFDLFISIFILKIFSIEGQLFELTGCVKCKKKIFPGKNTFSLSMGGIICPNCFEIKNLTILDDTVKLLKLATKLEYRDILKIKIDNNTESNFINIISSFEKYYFE